jgi:hypothetical protein
VPHKPRNARSAAPPGPTCFSWAAACYQYIGPLGHNPLGTYVPHQPHNARSAAPTGPTCFSWAAACYQYIGPLGHNPLGTYVPHKPHNARSAACYQYIGPLGHNPFGTYVPHQPRNARSAAPTGPTCFFVGGLLPIDWPAGPQSAGHILANETTKGRYDPPPTFRKTPFLPMEPQAPKGI